MHPCQQVRTLRVGCALSGLVRHGKNRGVLLTCTGPEDGALSTEMRRLWSHMSTAGAGPGKRRLTETAKAMYTTGRWK